MLLTIITPLFVVLQTLHLNNSLLGLVVDYVPVVLPGVIATALLTSALLH